MPVHVRKSSITRGNIKSLLNSDRFFSLLSDSDKNAFIDQATQLIATLKNSLNKPDYNFDTAGGSDGLVTAIFGYTKYASYVIINSGATYNDTVYPSNTILEASTPIGFSANPTYSRTLDVVTFLSSADEFDVTIMLLANILDCGWTRVDDGEITLDVSPIADYSGVVFVEIYKKV